MSRRARAVPAEQPPLPFDHIYDLPRFWDGRAVVWQGWRTRSRLEFHTPPPEPWDCLQCGSHADPHTNWGRVADSPLYSHAMIAADDEALARLPALVQRNFKPRGASFYRLTAFRCPICGHDQILDDTEQLWDLDEADYAENGSWPMTSFTSHADASSVPAASVRSGLTPTGGTP